jgi:DUF4097 and DUF4098 domain-containing protein YvlB
MLWTLATLAGLALAQQTDTTVAVESGTRLRVDNYGGQVQIRGGAENRVRVRAEHASRDRVELVRQGSTLTVKSESRRGLPQSVDFTITVPRWMAVAVSGVYIDADIAGTEGDVAVETVQGEVSLTGGNGFISLESVEGVVTVRGARGRIKTSSVNEGIEVYDAVGDLQVETVNGDVTLRGIDGTNVEATTVNGDIEYDGTMKDNGRYSFASHNGDITVSVPERANLTVGISTYQGEFDSTFPVTLEGVSPKRRFSFRLGSGSGRLEVESFQGDIRLRRPTEMRRERGKGDTNHDHDEDH